MKQIMTRLALSGSGAMLGLIGGALMFDPRSFLEMNHGLVDRDPGLMSELSAPSGVLIMTGALMWLAAIKLRFARLALVLGAVVYGSYGIGRLVSMMLHGLPSEALVSAMAIEFAVAGLLTALALTTRRDTNASEIDPHAVQQTF